MIGYGIPLIILPADAVVVDVDDASGVIIRSYRCFSSGYLANETVLHLYPSLEACYDRTLKWNDIYLNNRAKKIQRWWRSFDQNECLSEFPGGCELDEYGHCVNCCECKECITQLESEDCEPHYWDDESGDCVNCCECKECITQLEADE